MRVIRVFVVVFGIIATRPASAEWRIVQVDSGRVRSAPVQARRGEVVRLEVRRGRRALPPGSRVRWMRIVPRPQHEELAFPNEDDPTYANSRLGGDDHGEWLGFDTIEYEQREVAESRWVRRDGAALELTGAPAPVERVPDAGAGTLWLSAHVVLPDGREVHTAGIDDTDNLGLRAKVARVSFRTGDDFLGWMSSYFHVPYVFGSTPRQSERYTGIDCADVLVAGRRRESRRTIAYTSVNGIGRFADGVGEVLILRRGDERIRDGEGRPVTLRWGVDVHPGDMLAIDYADDPDGQLPRAWDHIGALLRDDGPEGRPDGVLGPEDLLRHMGRRGLMDEPLARHGSVRLRIWRWRR